DSLVGGTETAPPSTVAPTIIPMITEITASTPADGADQFVKVVASGAVNVDIRTSNGAESSVKDAINDQINRYVQVSEIKFKWSPGSGTLSAEIVYHDSDEIIFYLQGKRDTLSSDNQQTLFAAQTMYYQYVSSASTDLDKVKAIHDTIINNTTYEYTGSRSHTAAAVFVDGKAVCDGYAKAFNLLSYMAGISSMRITGYAGEDHAWNLVNVMGTWYHIDVTWDDPISTRPVLRYDYFLISDSKISADHSWTKYSEIPSCPENYYTDYASMVS
ncbi:MAG: transglutaminase domain-containing protein, partial [Eubacteriales bacterium]